MLKNAKTSKFSQWDFLFRSSFGPATIQGHSKKDISEGVLGTITVDFEDFQLDVHRLSAESEYEISHTVKPNAGKLGSEIPVSKLAKEVQTRIQHICNKSILGNLEKEDKEFIWMARHGLTHRPEALLKFLMSTDWTDVDYRNEAYRLMKTWKYPRNLPEVVELLGPEVADSCARNFAVDLLYAYDWVQIREVIPQLIQALKHEPYTFSSLSLFLLIRAVIDPITIGNDLFWYFKLEMNRPIHAEKFGLLLEALISLCGPYGIEYTKQNAIISRLERIGEAVAISKARGLQKKEVLGIYRSQLQNINDRILSQVKSWRNPLNPTMVLGLLDCEKCRYMSSKMAPLWLVFRNKDASASCTSIILKIGDDVRQDILTLQCMRMFELNWRSKDIDLKMSPYVCLATGVSSQKRGVGLIEVVENADTTSHIHWVRNSIFLFALISFAGIRR
jgi:phosphatidylinositol-4,5-bisphosphate 3-kinase